MEYQKHDHGKPRMELLPPAALEDTARVLGFGAEKYDDENWRKCDKPSRYLGAALRHTAAVMRGEKIDPESGLPHTAHAICSLMFYHELVEPSAVSEFEDVTRPVANVSLAEIEQAAREGDQILAGMKGDPIPPLFKIGDRVEVDLCVDTGTFEVFKVCPPTSDRPFYCYGVRELGTNRTLKYAERWLGWAEED